MVRVRSPGDPRLATPSRRTALPVYLDAISAPRRGALLGLFSDLSRARYALSRRTPGPGRAVAGARFSGARPLRIRGLSTAEGSRDYRGIYDIVGNIDTHSSLHIELSETLSRLCVTMSCVSLQAASMILNRPCTMKTEAVWCVPALRVPLVHSLINHFRQSRSLLSSRRTPASGSRSRNHTSKGSTTP